MAGFPIVWLLNGFNVHYSLPGFVRKVHIDVSI